MVQARWASIRSRHPDLEEWIAGYNEIRPHTSLDWDHLETPERAFMRKSEAMRLRAFLTAVEVSSR